MEANIIFSGDVPDGLIDDGGLPITESAFTVDDLDAFLYDNTDALEGATVRGNLLCYKTGVDADGYTVWGYAQINIIEDHDGGL